MLNKNQKKYLSNKIKLFENDLVLMTKPDNEIQNKEKIKNRYKIYIYITKILKLIKNL